MSGHITLDGRVVMDQAAFARFSETPSMAFCGPDHSAALSAIQITVDAGADKIMLEAVEPRMIQNPRLLADLHKAAQAGQVDGAFMVASTDKDRRLEAVVFDNSETWAGWTGCLNNPVDVGPVAKCRVNMHGGEPVELFRRADRSAIKYRVSRGKPLQSCDCGEH